MFTLTRVTARYTPPFVSIICECVNACIHPSFERCTSYARTPCTQVSWGSFALFKKSLPQLKRTYVCICAEHIHTYKERYINLPSIFVYFFQTVLYSVQKVYLDFWFVFLVVFPTIISVMSHLCGDLSVLCMSSFLQKAAIHPR